MNPGKNHNRWLQSHIEKVFRVNYTTLSLASILTSLLVCNRACGVWLPLSKSHNLSNTFSQSNPLRTPSQLHRLPYWFPLPTKCLPDPFSLNPGAIYVCSVLSFFLAFFFLSFFMLLTSLILCFLSIYYSHLCFSPFISPLISILFSAFLVVWYLHLTFLCLLSPPAFSQIQTWVQLPGSLWSLCY